MNFNTEDETKPWACHKSCPNMGTTNFKRVTDCYTVFNVQQKG